MNASEKLVNVKLILGITGTAEDTLLSAYIKMAEREILNWWCGASEVNEDVSFPSQYDVVQIHAVVAGYTIRGAEGQTVHNENGVQRTFVYDDMIKYIRAHVIPMVKVV